MKLNFFLLLLCFGKIDGLAPFPMLPPPHYLVLPPLPRPSPLPSSETAAQLPFWEAGLLSLMMVIVEKEKEADEGLGREVMVATGKGCARLPSLQAQTWKNKLQNQPPSPGFTDGSCFVG